MSTPSANRPSFTIRKLTPVVIVERIEPLLDFYVERLGFTKVAEVPHGDGLGFVMLVHGPVELMFQTVASAKADGPPREIRAAPVCLYMDVDHLDAAIAATAGAPVVVPRRVAPYGAHEIFLLDPAGNTVGLAQPGA